MANYEPNALNRALILALVLFIPLTAFAAPAPVITSVSALSKTEIAVQWTDVGTDIMQYRIEVSPGPDGPYVFQASGGTSSYIVSGLSPNTEYSIRMYSIDSAWAFSPYSNEARTTTMSDIDAPVLHATALSSKRIRLAWTDPTTNETAYSVEYRKGSNTDYTVLDPLPADTVTYTHTNLNAGSTYTYRVRSNFGSYYGPYSNEVTVTTGCVAEGQYLK